MANTKPDIPQDEQLTSKQKNWLLDLRACKGAVCLKRATLKQSLPSAIRRKPTGEVRGDIVAGRLVTDADKRAALAIGNELDWASLEADDLVEDADDVSDLFLSITLEANSEECSRKVKITRACPVYLGYHSTEEAFGARSAISELQYNTIRDKCTAINERLTANGQDWSDDFARCENWRAQKLRRDEVARTCQRVQSASTADEAFPDMADNLQSIKIDSLKKQYKQWLQERVDGWNRRCRIVQDYLTSNDESWEDWKTETMRVKRQTGDDRVIRKEVRHMTDDEWIAFTIALNKLKFDKIDGTSKYDLLVIYHTPPESPGAHWGPAFLPFHREWLKQLEVALRTIDPTIFVPYWDTTIDNELPTPADSIMWTPELFGNTKENVITGPFADWPATHELSFIPGMKMLWRDVGSSQFGGLFKESDIEYATSRTKYEQLTACVDPTFEMVHGVVHMFVGGYMADIGISPNDPTFFMHHCFIDYQWELFRMKQQTREQRESDYPPDDQSCNEFHYASSQMKPFPILNKDGLSNIYTDELYEYADRPTCTKANPNCNSKYMFCNTDKERCVSKVRPGGDCTGFQGKDICLGTDQCGASNRCPGREGVEDTTTTSTSTTAQITTPRTTSTLTTKKTTPTTTTTTTTTTRPTTTTTTTTTTRPTTTTQRTTTTTTTTRPKTTTTTTTTTRPTTTKQRTTTTTTRPTTTTQRTTTTATRPTTTTTTTTQRSTTTTTTQRPTTTTTRPTLAPPTTTIESTTTIHSTTKRAVELTTLKDWTDPSFPTTHFTVSVIRAADFTKPVAKQQRVDNVVVTATGTNVPNGYTQTTTAQQLPNSIEFPNYAIGYLVSVMDPAKAGNFALVQFEVEAKDSNGATCQPKCYNRYNRSYDDCNGKLRLSTNSYYSAPITFRGEPQEAVRANWNGHGIFATRKGDYLIFVCP